MKEARKKRETSKQEDLEDFNNIFWNIFIIKELSEKNH
jgi:hypothetical protein